MAPGSMKLRFLEARIPTSHLLRRINPVVTRVLAELREKLAPFCANTSLRKVTSARAGHDRGQY